LDNNYIPIQIFDALMTQKLTHEDFTIILLVNISLRPDMSPFVRFLSIYLFHKEHMFNLMKQLSIYDYFSIHWTL
jgi:hypothetical protein